jgi:hypothetical protein
MSTHYLSKLHVPFNFKRYSDTHQMISLTTPSMSRAINKKSGTIRSLNSTRDALTNTDTLNVIIIIASNNLNIDNYNELCFQLIANDFVVNVIKPIKTNMNNAQQINISPNELIRNIKTDIMSNYRINSSIKNIYVLSHGSSYEYGIHFHTKANVKTILLDPIPDSIDMLHKNKLISTNTKRKIRSIRSIESIKSSRSINSNNSKTSVEPIEALSIKIKTDVESIIKATNQGDLNKSSTKVPIKVSTKVSTKVPIKVEIKETIKNQSRTQSRSAIRSSIRALALNGLQPDTRSLENKTIELIRTNNMIINDFVMDAIEDIIADAHNLSDIVCDFKNHSMDIASSDRRTNAMKKLASIVKDIFLSNKTASDDH